MMKKRTVNEIKAEIASLETQLKALEAPKSKSTYVLVTDEMRIYGHRRFAFYKVALRHAKKGLTVMSLDEYRDLTKGKTRMVRNAMTGQLQEESMETPYSCSVASEAYWCS